MPPITTEQIIIALVAAVVGWAVRHWHLIPGPAPKPGPGPDPTPAPIPADHPLLVQLLAMLRELLSRGNGQPPAAS